ncbi:MAG: CHAD domain-containing protein [Pseudomonadota bacterium]
MKSHTELEWQFATADLAPARAWLASQPTESSSRRLAAGAPLEILDTYYDSSDWMIYRAGFALRLRQSANADAANAGGFEVTLKSLHAASSGFARRTEISGKVASADMTRVLAAEDAIAARIRELVGTRALAALFQVRTHREPLRLLEADSDLPLAEVALDDTAIDTPAGAAQQFTRVEVECINAEPAALDSWVEDFRAGAQLQAVQLSKFRAGLAAAGLDPEKRLTLGSLEISPRQDFPATQRAQLRRYLGMVLDAEPRVRVGTADSVHEMRVAARHLDVLLRSWQRRGPDWAVRERRTVRLLVRSLGAVRDRDVQIAHLDSSLAAPGDDEQHALRPMLDRLRNERSALRGRLLTVLDSERVRFWVQGWQEKLREEPVAAAGLAEPTGAIARELIREQARKLRKRARKIGAESGPDDFHEVRIRAKRLRYTLDAFAALYGEAAHIYTRALGRLQDILGAFHDAAVREQHFVALANDAQPLPSSTYFAMGRLVERDRRAFERCRRKFPKAYSRVRGRRWRALADAMRSHSPPETS